MDFTAQMVFYIVVSVISGSLLIRQYRAATSIQRRQIAVASFSAATVAVVGVLVIMIFR